VASASPERAVAGRRPWGPSSVARKSRLRAIADSESYVEAVVARSKPERRHDCGRGWPACGAVYGYEAGPLVTSCTANQHCLLCVRGRPTARSGHSAWLPARPGRRAVRRTPRPSFKRSRSIAWRQSWKMFIRLRPGWSARGWGDWPWQQIRPASGTPTRAIIQRSHSDSVQPRRRCLSLGTLPSRKFFTAVQTPARSRSGT
jgi:hypothetical protein